MTKKNLLITILLFACLQTFGQHVGFSFQNAKKQGIDIKQLDSIYKSAVHTDTSLAVFKTDKEQEAMYNAYVKLLQDFSNFLTENNFIGVSTILPLKPNRL